MIDTGASESAANEMNSDRASRLRVASYNIYKGNYLADRGGRSVGADFRSSARLREADVLLVQEAAVGQMSRRAPHRDAISVLADAFGLEPARRGAAHVRFLGEAHGHDALWGVAILSRTPAAFHDVPLPRPRWSPWPRGAILAEIGPFLVATLHLEVWPIGAGARRRQVEHLLGAIRSLDPEGLRPTVIAGDFNCEAGAAHRLLAGAGFEAAGLTETTWGLGPLLRMRLDHAYVRGARITASGVEHRARGSDHRPIWVEIETLLPTLQTVP